ncbi:MAG: M23 family metallopeptidase [Clostridiales bacterium]|nr:M23 family metallopeptidase [Clostridiales bacterium]
MEGGVISDVFGERTSPITGKTELHNGIDIAVPTGTRVLAVSPGKITAAGNSPSYGLYIKETTEEGYTFLYAHLSEHRVTEGQTVERGETIALSGMTGWATGPHLHLTAEKNGEAFDPLTLYPEFEGK